jgi:hypothetical protein
MLGLREAPDGRKPGSDRAGFFAPEEARELEPGGSG